MKLRKLFHWLCLPCEKVSGATVDVSRTFLYVRPASAVRSNAIARKVHLQFRDGSLRRQTELHKGRSLFCMQRVLPPRPKRVVVPVRQDSNLSAAILQPQVISLEPHFNIQSELVAISSGISRKGECWCRAFELRGFKLSRCFDRLLQASRPRLVILCAVITRWKAEIIIHDP